MGKYNEVLNWVNRADDSETIGREDEDEEELLKRCIVIENIYTY